jgi:hypothetical protein
MQMNALIFHPNTTARETIRHRLERLGHVVIHDDSSLYQTLIGMVEYRVNLVFLAELEPAMRTRVETIFGQWSLPTTIIWVPTDLRGTALEAHLERELSRLN